MSSVDSVHGKLDKIRKPRVHISYDVETEGASIKKELPFVVGVMGDFSGDSTQPLQSLKDRKFIQIDGDNFDQVMRKMTPGAKFKVANTLQDDDSEIAVDLKFNSMEDFEPINIVKQVEPLKNLIETRNKLSDLLSKADCSEKLESILEDVLQNNEQLNELAKQLGSNQESSQEGDKS